MVWLSREDDQQRHRVLSKLFQHDDSFGGRRKTTIRVSDTSSEEEWHTETPSTPPRHVSDTVKSSDEECIPATPDPSSARPRQPRVSGKLSISLKLNCYDFEAGVYEEDVSGCISHGDPPHHQKTTPSKNPQSLMTRSHVKTTKSGQLTPLVSQELLVYLKTSPRPQR